MNYDTAKEKIKDFIKEKTKQFNGGVIGLSGGIDSTLVAHLATEAIGKERMYGLILPYDNQSNEDGELVANNLGIAYETINIKPIVDAFENQKPEYFDFKLGKGNLMARTRMCLLRAAAGKKNMIVLGTTNLSEAMVGYATKNGDDGVDIEPIGDLYKTEVWELAKRIGVPTKLVDKTPTAGLWEGQTDEGELGFSYTTLDRVLQGFTEGIDTTIVEKIQKLIGNSQHKREMPPVCRLR